MTPATSWGRTAPCRPAGEWRLSDRSADLPLPVEGRTMLAHGLGRSYGDVALNEGGQLLRTRGLDRFIAFDSARGVIRAEAGVSLEEIIEIVLPQGWFIPVTPGTRYVTLGGAVANDVHGKNHHRAGTFGEWITAIELLRSDGSRQVCTPGLHADWLQATIGGLGLTGLITWVEIQLVRVRSPWIWAINRRFADLNEYWSVDAELGASHEFTVAWVDCTHGARGIYTAGDFAPASAGGRGQQHRPRPRRVRADPPISLVNSWTVAAFNALYYHRPLRAEGLSHFLQFFYPLDAIQQWNRIYGRHGFFQYQCVLPSAAMKPAAGELFRLIERHRQGSMLAVFKTFGSRPARGLLSFPRAGATLALDFPNLGEETRRLFRELDAVVGAAGGALYPAKDACMSAQMFRSAYPGIESFTRFVDPRFSSSFWRRVMS